MWKVVRNDGVTQPTRQPPSLIFKSSAPMFLAFGRSCTFVSLWQPQPSTRLPTMISNARTLSLPHLSFTHVNSRGGRTALMRPTHTRTSTSRPGSSFLAYSSRDDAEVRTQTVHNVTSKHELDELVKSASKEAKITVLEVAKLGSIGKEGKPRKSTAQVSTTLLRVATDFKDKAVFAELYIDHSEATKCAAESLKVQEVPCVFIWDDQGELASELETVSVDALHHAVSRVLGVRDERG